MTSEDRQTEISDYVAYLDTLYDEVTSKVNREAISVTVLGFSQGGSTASRWVTLGRSRIDRLVLWGSFLASDVDLNLAAKFFRDVKLTIVYGKKDKYAGEKMIRDYQTLLKEKTIPFDMTTFDGGHRMDRGTLKSFARDS
jgi:predicted esterase